MTEPVPMFFIDGLRYDRVTLIVELYSGERRCAQVLFIHPRAFRTYDDSDQWEYLSRFEGTPLLASPDGGSAVLLSKDAPYVTDYRAHVREQEPEETFSCLIKTPQECVEVICFEEPTIIRL